MKSPPWPMRSGIKPFALIGAHPKVDDQAVHARVDIQGQSLVDVDRCMILLKTLCVLSSLIFL